MSDRLLTDTLFESFSLHPSLQKGLNETSFLRLTPIQQLTLPVALEGKDVAGQAQTGTGKTCAFLVALMQRLLSAHASADHRSNDPRALIVAPTRELAIQIHRDAELIGMHTGLESVAVYGGVDYDKQRQQLAHGCDIVVATPGRLIDFYKQKVFSLKSIEVMVLDEADRMFDLGFIKDIRYIFRQIPPRTERQVLLYSATLSQRVLELAYEHMNEAQKLEVKADHVTADQLQQTVYFPAREEKLPLLLNLLQQEKPERTIVFVNTRRASNFLRDRLRRQGYRVGLLSGDVSQDKRQRVLKRFTDDKLEVLVCTDVAARGLHIPHVSHVFNYDLPQDAEDYVHRIGRTGRLGEKGIAISFACDMYAMSLPDIEAYIGEKITVENLAEDLLVMPKPIREPERKPTAQTHHGAVSNQGNKPKSRRRRKRKPSHAERPHDAQQTQAKSQQVEGEGKKASADKKQKSTPETKTSTPSGKNTKQENRHRSRSRSHSRQQGKKPSSSTPSRTHKSSTGSQQSGKRAATATHAQAKTQRSGQDGRHQQASASQQVAAKKVATKPKQGFLKRLGRRLFKS